MKFLRNVKILLIVIVIIITIIAFFKSDNDELLWTVCLVYPILAISMLCLYDVSNFCNNFKNFVTTFNNYTRKKDNISFCTPLGNALNEYFTFLERKILSLKKDNDKYNKDEFKNPINFLKKLDVDPDRSKEEFFRSILNILSGFYQKNAIVLFYYNPNTFDSFAVSSLSSNKHVSMFIKQLFLNKITNKKEIKEGVVYYYNVENVLEDLSLFGYKKAIIKKINLVENDNCNDLIYLWFGDSNLDFANGKEENFLDGLSYEIGAKYDTFLKLQSAKKEIEKKTNEAIKKSEYLEFVSHDLKSPLSNLVSVLKLLEINQDANNKKEFIEIALNNCDSISLLLDDLLDFSKYKNSELKVYKEKVYLENELTTLINNYSLRAAQKNLGLNLIDNSKNSSILVDKRQFRKIINNLISNAIKYTQKGRVELSCNIVRNKAVIKVSDTGIGISKENLNEIFSSFKRGDNAEHLEGYGLGLFMVKIFSELNDIMVDVESEVNKGSIFTLTIPIFKDENKKSSKAKRKTNKIVLIEDDVDLLNSTKRLLELQGFLVQGFDNIQNASDFLLSNKTDLIISDYYIGTKRVDDLLNFLNDKKIKTDVILCTGKSDIDINEYKKLGIKEVLQKPLNVNEILK